MYQYNSCLLQCIICGRLETGFRQYAEFVQARSEESQALLVQDPRSEEEKIQAADLQANTQTTQNPPPAFTEDHRPSSRLQSMSEHISVHIDLGMKLIYLKFM